MFVATLKNNFQSALIVLLSTSIFLWLLSFRFADTAISATYHHILYDSFFLNIESFFAKKILIFLSISIGAFLVNYMAISQEVISKNNYTPAFLYILFGFSASTSNDIEPILIANLVLMPALYFVINTYRSEGVLTPFYNAGLLLGLATFFYTFYVFLFPVLFIALIITRSFVWREWTVMLLGIVTPVYLYMCICYLSGEPVFKIIEVLHQNLGAAQMPHVSEYHIVFLALIAFTLLLTLVHYLTKGFGNKIKATKTKQILLWLLVMGAVLCIYQQDTDMFFLPCIIPLSILIGDYLAEIKQLKIANTLLFFILCGFALIYAQALNLL